MKEKDNKDLTPAAQILAAIEDSKYKSRTAAGISNQLGIPTTSVERLITTDTYLKERVLVVPGIKKNNQNLYTTVEKYKNEAPLAVRVLNLINKVRTK